MLSNNTPVLTIRRILPFRSEVAILLIIIVVVTTIPNCYGWVVSKPQPQQQQQQNQHLQYSTNTKYYQNQNNIINRTPWRMVLQSQTSDSNELKINNNNNNNSPVGVVESSNDAITSTTTSPATPDTAGKEEDDDDDEEEYDYIEYEILTETEFVGSEWLIGTNWNDNPNTIQETWVRLVVDEKSGKNIAIWGDNNKGTWTLDIASQFFSISKEYTLFGKDIWACTVADYYYLQGTVRGWKYWTPASVLGQWQARRLNIDKDEAGIAPWFDNSNTNDDDTTTTSK